MFNDFLIRKWTWIVHVINAYLMHDLYLMKVFLTLNWKNLVLMHDSIF